MDERQRACIRGCRVRGKHIPTCAGVSCDGCLPMLAADGAMICERDIRSLRHTIGQAPDLCAHIRSIVDPQKAQVYDREKLSGAGSSESQPPVSVEMLDAADEVLGILAYWAEYYGDEMDYRGRRTFPAGVDSEDAYYLANTPSSFLLANLEAIVNDGFVRLMAERVLGPTPDPEDWTIAKVLRRWPLHERSKFSQMPCPGCEMRTVLVKPPRRAGDERLYECRNDTCSWAIPEDERIIWAEYFEGAVA